MLSKIKRGLGRGLWVWHGLFVRNFSWDILMNKKRKYLTGDMETHVQCPVCPGPPSQCLHSLQTGSGLVLLRAMSGQENCNIYHVEHSHIFSIKQRYMFSCFLDNANNLWDRVIEYLSDMIMSKLLVLSRHGRLGHCLELTVAGHRSDTLLCHGCEQLQSCPNTQASTHQPANWRKYCYHCNY